MCGSEDDALVELTSYGAIDVQATVEPEWNEAYAEFLTQAQLFVSPSREDGIRLVSSAIRPEDGTAEAIADACSYSVPAEMDIEVEPRAQLLVVGAPLFMNSAEMLKVAVTKVPSNVLLKLSKPLRFLTAAGLMRLSGYIHPLSGAPLLKIRTMRPSFFELTFEVNVTPHWTVDAEMDASVRNVCTVREFLVDGSSCTTVELEADVENSGIASVEAIAVPQWTVDAIATAHMLRPYTDVDAYARTVRDMIVTVEPSGGTIDLESRLQIFHADDFRVHAAATGEPSFEASVASRPECVVDFEAMVEVNEYGYS